MYELFIYYQGTFFLLGVCIHIIITLLCMVKTHFRFLIIIYAKTLAAEVYRKMNWLTRFFCPWTIVLLILCVGEENTICSAKIVVYMGI